MSQAEHDLQLKVWKELAISKQMLMRAATEALGLDPECTQEQLKAALEGLSTRVAGAEADAAGAKAAAATAVAALEKKLAERERELAAALESARQAKASHETAVQQIINQRAAASAELQKVKDRLAEREKALKAINVALADTPANVLQKMNTLRKQRQEDTEARRDLEAALGTLRAEKRQHDQAFAELTKNGGTLVARHRELHALAQGLREQLAPLVEDAKALPEVAELDATLLEAIEKAAERGSERPARLRAVNS